jgi:segregation and condensation protein A
METNLRQAQFSHQTGSYTVAIPVYEGPLDLLLQLIERAELNITSVSLAQVTDQYLGHIRQMQVPADEISAFLVVAAKLLQIKSEALLQAGSKQVGRSREACPPVRVRQRLGNIRPADDRQQRHPHTYLRIVITVN